MSCQTLPEVKPATKGTVDVSEPVILRSVEYTAGKVVNSPYPLPDSSLTPDPDPLTEEHITGDDIEPEAVMATAVAWSKQYHDLAATYNILRGWILGVRAAQDLTEVDDAKE